MKIFTTAILLVAMLKRRLSIIQWLSLLMLSIGVIDVQLQQTSTASNQHNSFIGLASVIAMCCTSAFAGIDQSQLYTFQLIGVYMEMVLKQSATNVWIQNIRLALIGIPISCIMMIYNDYDTIRNGSSILIYTKSTHILEGMYVGWDSLVWTMTLTNSIGGLLIAIVMKYADNILKAYAQSMAIIGAAVGSAIVFDFQPNLMFIVGTTLVIVSICLYTRYPYKSSFNQQHDDDDVRLIKFNRIQQQRILLSNTEHEIDSMQQRLPLIFDRNKG